MTWKCTKCGKSELRLVKRRVGGALGTQLTFECSACKTVERTYGTWGNTAFFVAVAVAVAGLAFGVQRHPITAAPAAVYVVIAAMIGLAIYQVVAKLTFDGKHPPG